MTVYSKRFFNWIRVATAFGMVLLAASPAFAHHAFGGRTPANFFEGFLAGLAHPVIGLDHLAFVVAAGLLAVSRGTVLIPIAFVVAALAGTGLHVASWDLPILELVIAASVLGFGALLAVRNAVPGWALAALAALAGVFHGYAYGEAIVGAQMNPLLAYLLGFTAIQLAISLGAYRIGKAVWQREGDRSSLPLQFAGFTICGMGAAFLASSVMG
ncbi:MAG TPA: HupE/UreJ family protein [Oscillatoriales cyanobacterium M59_W2019_021]|nr:MAG: hydantoin utilization protein A [Cyanobacteria bacterium J055]HIK32307.1 HupE/UreJ family protein [Oscillatoriales cyanobacterium M4454_W2019_049]HIK53250.1 HupE/UreJ family protein [Oscillatoriales cyanobacterium M59_W2019_021]